MKILKELKKLPNNLCDNTNCSGKPKDIRPVKMKKEFEGGWFYWCEKCRKRDNDMIIEIK